MNKLQHGKSKEKYAKPEEMNWFFNWCVRVNCMSFDDVIKSIGKKKQELEIDKKLTNYARNCSVVIAATKGRWYGSSSVIETPEEVIDQQRKAFEKDMTDQKRFNAQSPDEQEKEINDLLKELGKSQGFCAVKI
jgi:hypothetical protein